MMMIDTVFFHCISFGVAFLSMPTVDLFQTAQCRVSMRGKENETFLLFRPFLFDGRETTHGELFKVHFQLKLLAKRRKIFRQTTLNTFFRATIKQQVTSYTARSASY